MVLDWFKILCLIVENDRHGKTRLCNNTHVQTFIVAMETNTSAMSIGQCIISYKYKMVLRVYKHLGSCVINTREVVS